MAAASDETRCRERMGDIPGTEGMTWEQQDSGGRAGKAEVLVLGLSTVCIWQVQRNPAEKKGRDGVWSSKELGHQTCLKWDQGPKGALLHSAREAGKPGSLILH